MDWIEEEDQQMTGQARSLLVTPGAPPSLFPAALAKLVFLPPCLRLSIWIDLVSSQLYVTEEEDSKKMQDKSH